MNRSALFRIAFRDSIPVLMGYVTMGFAAGVLFAVKVQAPYAPVWGFCMAVSILSGTMQFACVPHLAAHASLLSVALVTLAVNFRYAFYGFSMIERWKHLSFLKKAFLIGGLSDETYALESSRTFDDPADHLRYCVMLTALDISYWAIGVTSGTIVGNEFEIPSKGIEFAMVALFLVIFTDQMRGFYEAWRAKKQTKSEDAQ